MLSLLLFLLPLMAYSVATNVMGIDELEAGKWIGVGFTAGASFLWVFTYIFRVATKDMTYVREQQQKKPIMRVVALYGVCLIVDSQLLLIF